MTTALAPVKRTVRQIVGADGQPAQATATSNLWLGGVNAFAVPTENNKVEAFTTGKDYFASLISACRGAQTEICMAGWQISWDGLLAPGLRLYDLLREIVSGNRSVMIYVMPWNHSLPVETYDGQTATVLRQINEEFKTKQIRIIQSPSYAPGDTRYFAHHQKQVVVDRKIAFVGGIDVAYGRYDDNTYDLHADKDGREAMNRYNGCVAQVAAVSAAVLVNPDLMTGALDNLRVPLVSPNSTADAEIAKLHKPGHWQPKYASAGTLDTLDNAKMTAGDAIDATTLDAATQPRMPWQDVHCRIEGPAVSDLLRNFVLRWNIEAADNRRLAVPEAPLSYPAAGQMLVQVLRSAPSNQCTRELAKLSPRPAQPTSTATQDNIYQAMLGLIEKSRRFIYIENQFFVGAFGREAPRTGELSPAAKFIDTYPGSSQNATAIKMGWANSRSKVHFRSIDRAEVLAPPTNRICQALIRRIAIAIKSKTPFHVYMTLPVHPEGTLCTANIATQVYWTMQTLVFGSHSLLNGVRRALKERELHDKKDPDPARAFADDNTEYESIPIEQCFEYVTLLNLRNWAKLGDRYVTEQVYVHSKLMIVDDMYALLGSANVNDRSMLGDRDSELAVLVMDKATTRADVNGVGSHKEVRVFAHELRKSIWKKLFGIAGGVRPATELASAIEQPGSPASWRAIQKRAAKNAELYEAAFPWVPRSWVKTDIGTRVEASILPTWNADSDAPPSARWSNKGRLESLMPFQPAFWDAPRHLPPATHLDQIKGFISALPIMWTKGENNRFEYPTNLVAENESDAGGSPPDTQVGASTSTQRRTDRGAA